MRARSPHCPQRAGLALAAAVSLCGFLPAVASSLTTLWSQGGHASRISAVACSPNGTVVASASDDFTIKLWSTNGALLSTLNTAPSPATAVAFSPDGTRLAVGTYFGGFAQGSVNRSGYSSIPGLGLVYLWQATDGWASDNASLVRVYTNRFGKITSLAFSGDGLRLAWGNAAGSNVVSSTAGASVLASRPGYDTQVGPAAVTSVALSASGWLLSGCEDRTLRLWNSSWSQVWSARSPHASNVTSVAFSPDGASFVSASLDGTLRLWSTNGALVRTLSGNGTGFTAVAFSPDGAKVASGSLDGNVELWDPVEGTHLTTLSAHAGPVSSVAFMPDSTRLLSGGEDALVRLWSAADGTLLETCGGQSEFIAAAAISPDGSLCASAGGGSSIAVRRAVDGTSLFTLEGHSDSVSVLAFSPDNATLASGGGPLDPMIKLWSLTDGALVRTIAAGTNGVTALAFSPDGHLLASGGDYTEQTISVWAPSNGDLVRTLPGHSNGVTALAFSPGGELLASGGRRFDHTVKIWALTNGALLHSFTGHGHNIEAVAFSPDGSLVASGSSGPKNLIVWQLPDGGSRTFGAGTDPVTSVGFSADGTALASAEGDAIRFWSVASGDVIETVARGTFRVTCFAYSPNGNVFLYGREDATVVLCTNSGGALSRSPLAFTKLSAPSAGSIGFSADVSPGTRYIIQSSSDLTTWRFLTQASSPTESVSVTNLPTPSTPTWYLRALTPP